MLKRFCLYIAIPFVIALLFRLFRLAQGEKLEEIVSGIFVGILIDFILSIIFLLAEKRRNR